MCKSLGGKSGIKKVKKGLIQKVKCFIFDLLIKSFGVKNQVSKIISSANVASQSPEWMVIEEQTDARDQANCSNSQRT